MSDSERDSNQDLFRAEARRYYQSRIGARAESIPVPPSWLGWAFRLLMVAVLAGLIFLCVGHIGEYTEGTVIVRVANELRPPQPQFLLVLPDRGDFAPTPGSPAYLRIDEYPETELSAKVTGVLSDTSRVNPPPELRALADSDSLSALILAEATLEDERFLSGRPPFRLRDGMQGSVRILKDEVPIILYLVPGLRRYQEGRSDDHSR